MSEAQRLNKIARRVALEKRLSPIDFDALIALGSFDCPKKRDPKNCGTACPARPTPVCGCPDKAHLDNPFACPKREDDYYDECLRALAARALLMKAGRGEVRVG